MSGGTIEETHPWPVPAAELPVDLRTAPSPERARPEVIVTGSGGPTADGRSAPKSFPLLVVAWALASLSVLTLWLLAFGFVFSGWHEAGAQRRLYAQARQELAAQTGPIGGKIAVGAPVAVIDVPRLRIRHLVVVEGTSSSDLRSGPGHRRDTPLPGQPGSSVVMGRSLLYGAPFEHIPKLRRGDRVVVQTGQGTFKYVVDATRLPGDPVPAIKAKASRLTLITARAKGGLTSKREAVFVDSHLVGTPQDPPTSKHPTINRDEEPMAEGHGSLVVVFLYLELLILVVTAVVWAVARWGVRPSLIVGAPLLIGALWLVTDAAAVLLPNLV